MMYEWPRFWIPRENLNRIRTGNFLYDPQGEYRAALSPGVVSLDDLATHPLLVLLGEPAAGKSQAVADYVNAQPTLTNPALKGAVPPRYRLNAEPGMSVVTLRQEFRSYGESPGTEVFLDSVDEVTIIDMERFIPELIRESHRKGTRLRVVCRTASLTPRLEAAIRQASLAAGIEPRFYALAQLRERDARTIANALKFNPDAFLKEIGRSEAWGFAAQAGNLRAMAEVFCAHGKLPERHWDLWEEQMRLTVKQAHEQTVGRARPSNDVRGCLNLLSRVAAATIFGDRSGIASDQVSVASEGLLRIDQVADHPEEEWNDGENANSDEMTRIINLAPLSPEVDPAVIGWSARPHAEFLTARYLLNRSLGFAQLRELLADREQGRIVPQLHQVAILLSSRREEFFDFILERDPHLALRGDVRAASRERRTRLAHHLLAAIEAGRLTWNESNDVGYGLSRLTDLDLTETIRPFLTTSNHAETRSMAADMAGASGTTALIPDLLALLDPIPEVENDLDLALHVVSALGALTTDPDSRRSIAPRLKELANRPSPSIDPDHSLLGKLLDLLWPDELDLSTLLSRLVPPFFHSYRDAYRDFLCRLLPQRASEADLPALIEWVRAPFDAAEREEVEDEDESTNFADSIARESYRRLSVPGVIEALARYVIDHAENPYHRRWIWEDDPYHSKRVKAWRDSEFPPPASETRLSFAFAIVSLIEPSDPESDYQRYYLWRGLSELVGRDNLIPLTDMSQGTDRQASVARALLRHLPPPPNDVNPLANILAQAIQPEISRSEVEARAMALVESLAVLDTALVLAESEAPRAYLEVERALAALVPDDRVHSFRDMEITAWSGWLECSADLRQRILKTAERFVRSSESVVERQPHQIYGFDVSGARALRLLTEQGHPMPPEIWRRWTVAILSIPAGHDDPGQEVLQRQAFEIDRQGAIAWYVEAMRTQSVFHVPNTIEPFLLEDLGTALAASRSTFTPEVRGSFYKDLERLKHPDRRAWLREDWESSSHSEVPGLADQLARSGDATDGDAVLQRLLNQPEIVEPVLAAFAAHIDAREFLANPFFSVPLLERLASELIDRYPSSEDPRHPGAYTSSVRDRLAELRGAVVVRLGLIPGDAALDAVRRLHERYSNIGWIENQYRNALHNRMFHVWNPIVPTQLRTILRDPARTLIRSDQELLVATIASIARLQARIDSRRLRWTYWREIVRRKTKDEPEQVSLEPYIEERVSDLVMEHLDRDLSTHAVIGNREAIVGRHERHDIRLEIRRRDGDRIVDHKIVIEVKLGTNSKVRSSMKTQLRDRYLTEGQTSYGLYLVVHTGRSEEPLWDDQRLDAKGLAEALVAEATTLSDSRTIRATVLDITLPE